MRRLCCARAFAEGRIRLAVGGQRSAIGGQRKLFFAGDGADFGEEREEFRGGATHPSNPPAKLAGPRFQPTAKLAGPGSNPPAKLAGTRFAMALRGMGHQLSGKRGCERRGAQRQEGAGNGHPALVDATYTRVAIDLGDGVTYEAARVPNPDRIFFDLHGTRLAQELVGKSFLVTDDGFLKRIRAAQYSDDVTRVVLDVNDVTEYSAFLLPNPPG